MLFSSPTHNFHQFSISAPKWSFKVELSKTKQDLQQMQQRAQGCGKKRKADIPAKTCKWTRQKIEKSKTLGVREGERRKRRADIYHYQHVNNANTKKHAKYATRDTFAKTMKIDEEWFAFFFSICGLRPFTFSFWSSFRSFSFFEFPLPSIFESFNLCKLHQDTPTPLQMAKFLPVRFLQSTCHSFTTSCSPQSGLMSHVTISSRRSNSESGQAQHTQVATKRKSAWRRIATSTSHGP